jgi:predicted O-methyltransferase YrrM
MIVNLSQRLLHAARTRKTLRPIVTALARWRARRRGGGVVYVNDDDLLTLLVGGTGRACTRSFGDYLRELREDEPLRRTFEDVKARYQLERDGDWDARLTRLPGNAVLFYALVRELQPELTVETGTARGSMTSWILAALERNAKGRLISIDLPAVAGQLAMSISVAPEDTGCFIPEAYRRRWDYRMGDAKVLLPQVMAEQAVDLFIHDSLHARTHMVFEYAVARALMREGSVIVSDDIGWNNGYVDFLALHRLTGYAPFSNPNISAFVNMFDAAERALGLGIVDSSRMGIERGA